MSPTGLFAKMEIDFERMRFLVFLKKIIFNPLKMQSAGPSSYLFSNLLFQKKVRLKILHSVNFRSCISNDNFA